MAYGTLLLVFTNLIGMYASFLFELDAREQFQKKKLLKQLALTDGLTGIDNSPSFDEHLGDAWGRQEKSITRSQCCSLISINSSFATIAMGTSLVTNVSRQSPLH